MIENFEKHILLYTRVITLKLTKSEKAIQARKAAQSKLSQVPSYLINIFD